MRDLPQARSDAAIAGWVRPRLAAIAQGNATAIALPVAFEMTTAD
jgi:hypothetical protein